METMVKRPARNTIVVATRNTHKLKEIRCLLRDMKLNVLGVDAFAQAPKVVENGRTFRANAVKKARVIARHTGLLTIADDSGLCVDALAGAPGVISARFSGRGATDQKNNAKLLGLLRNVPMKQRGAAFVCVIALADEQGVIGVVEGSHRGAIGFTLRGNHGFGYDPLFYSPGLKKTFAQLGRALKNKVSHRARALAKARRVIGAYFHVSPGQRGRKG